MLKWWSNNWNLSLKAQLMSPPSLVWSDSPNHRFPRNSWQTHRIKKSLVKTQSKWRDGIIAFHCCFGAHKKKTLGGCKKKQQQHRIVPSVRADFLKSFPAFTPGCRSQRGPGGSRTGWWHTLLCPHWPILLHLTAKALCRLHTWKNKSRLTSMLDCRAVLTKAGVPWKECQMFSVWRIRRKGFLFSFLHTAEEGRGPRTCFLCFMLEMEGLT